MEKYDRVHGHANVEATLAALEASGCKILTAPRPDVAPFEFKIETPEREVLELVCYAFTANKYEQGGRPTDEHRMQVKYGSDFSRYHELFIDPAHRRITLMYGWHAEERIFVAVDPAMHNPTWFSRSIEFKDEDVKRAKRTGWHGWERDRKSGRRKAEMPLDDCRTESLLGIKPKNFLKYVMLERIATGMDAGERLLMIDRIARGASQPLRHPLEMALGLPASEILDVLGGSFRLLVAVRGSVAERHLLDRLNATEGLTHVKRFDADGQPDFEVTYRRRKLRIECKNVLRRLPKSGVPRVDFQKTRASKTDPCSRYYSPNQFEVLAACMHPVSEQWEYSFAPTRALPTHSRCTGKISDKVSVAGPYWSRNVLEVLDRVLER